LSLDNVPLNKENLDEGRHLAFRQLTDNNQFKNEETTFRKPEDNKYFVTSESRGDKSHFMSHRSADSPNESRQFMRQFHAANNQIDQSRSDMHQLMNQPRGNMGKDHLPLPPPPLPPSLRPLHMRFTPAHNPSAAGKNFVPPPPQEAAFYTSSNLSDGTPWHTEEHQKLHRSAEYYDSLGGSTTNRMASDSDGCPQKISMGGITKSSQKVERGLQSSAASSRYSGGESGSEVMPLAAATQPDGAAVAGFPFVSRGQGWTKGSEQQIGKMGTIDRQIF
jgi:hypothetical protein